MNNGNRQQHIYVFAATYPFECESNSLPEARQAEIEVCSNEKVRQEKFYVFKLLEIALKEAYSKDINKCGLVQNACGKWTSDICELSLSHCDNIVAVALSNCCVGVDVERIDGSRFCDKLQGRIFTACEADVARGMNESERADYANRLWTVKEAAFKRNGGSSFAASQIESATVNCQTVTLEDGNGRKYYLSLSGESDAAIEYHLERLTVKLQ